MPTPPEPVDPPPDTDPAEEGRDETTLGVLEALSIEQVTLTIPSTVIDPEAPAEPLSMLDFRASLLRDSTPLAAKDRAWRHLCRLARAQRGDWNLYALGVAYPRLRKDANRLRGGRSWVDWQQIHFDLAVAFLFGVHRNRKLDNPSVFRRLADNAYDQTSGRKASKRPPDVPLHVLQPMLKPRENPHAEHGNPERETLVALANRRSVHEAFQLLAAAINAAPGRQRITRVQATLLRRTYLSGDKLRDVATDLKLSEPSASKQRTRAENTIARFLDRPDLVEPDPPNDEQAATDSPVTEPAATLRTPRPRTEPDIPPTAGRQDRTARSGHVTSG